MNKKTNCSSLILLCRASFFSIVITALFYGCGPHANLAGTSSGVETKIARGTMVDEQGIGSAHTEVLLVPSRYNPVSGGPLPHSFLDTTDASGCYAFHDIDTGAYNVLSTQALTGTMALHCTVQFNADTVYIPTDTLRKPGAINVGLPGGADTVRGYVYIPGTPIASFLNGNGESLVLARVPAGTIPSVCYSALNSKVSNVIRYDIRVVSGDTCTIVNPSWLHARPLRLNTTSSGAGVAGTVTNFPALIRLTQSNFDFSEAQATGDDLRFTKADSTPLPFEIERWDPVAGLAEIWVKVDTVFGNDGSHFITMYWGNPAAPGLSNGAAVFDTADGFQGIWHLNDPAASPVKDATFNAYNGIRYNMTGSGAAGSIGIGRDFLGDSSYIIMPGTAASKLSFLENGVYAISAWVYADTLDSVYQTIISKGDQQYNLEILDNGWEFAQYRDKQGWEMSQSPLPAAPKQWVHVVGVRDQTRQYLYVNGQCVDSTTTMLNAVFSRYAGYDLMIGKTNGALMPDFPYYFHGVLDEIRVNSRALSADWIKSCYMNQKIPDALIVW